MSETNINELLQLLDASNNILVSDLTYSSLVEDSIKQNGGTVIYSYNNIIVASDISETFYNELQKNPNIDYIENLALKQYGEIDSNLMAKLNNSGSTSGTDGQSGNSGISGISGSTPTILNSTFTLSASTNEIFNYTIVATGTTPIDFSIVKPDTYSGTLELKNINIINGQTSKAGIYNVKFLANNNYGTDVKYLTLSIIEPTKILNTNLIVYNNFGTTFYYTIEASGAQSYDVYGIPGSPSNIIKNSNMISGYFNPIGSYILTLIASGTTSSDSKTLTVNVGEQPIINSSGEWIIEQNKYDNYNISSTDFTTGVTYNVIGVLPQGLSFSTDMISGNPIQQGEYYVTLMATNPYGEDSKDLKIIVSQMGQNF